MDDFLIRAAIAGIGVALVAGPLGSFVVWRRMAYFGDTLAHSALLGVVLGFLLGIDLNLGVIAVCVCVAALLLALQRQRRLAGDTLLGILSHSTLSLGLVALAFMDSVRLDLMGYLFGDLLAVTKGDIAWVWGGGLAALAVLAFIWRSLLAITVHDELARVEGVNAAYVRLTFVLLIAVVIAVAMKVIGILLITALLIIPAATARRFASTPEQMAIVAAGFGALAVCAGLIGSMQWDTPSGPSVVVAAAAFFALAYGMPARRFGGAR